MAGDDDRMAPASSASHGQGGTFAIAEIAAAFDVAGERVVRAVHGEFGQLPDQPVDSRQAQHLAEVILGDQPLEQREAALMRLGAYTPRADITDASVDEKPVGEQSDRIRPSEEVPDIGAPREDG